MGYRGVRTPPPPPSLPPGQGSPRVGAGAGAGAGLRGVQMSPSEPGLACGLLCPEPFRENTHRTKRVFPWGLLIAQFSAL